MLTVDIYARIRQAHRDGMSIHAIASTFHHSRRKVREVLANPQPKPFTRSGEPLATKLGGFHHLIQQILADDERGIVAHQEQNRLGGLVGLAGPLQHVLDRAGGVELLAAEAS